MDVLGFRVTTPRSTCMHYVLVGVSCVGGAARRARDARGVPRVFPYLDLVAGSHPAETAGDAPGAAHPGHTPKV
jgi:hypothetical protein